MGKGQTLFEKDVSSPQIITIIGLLTGTMKMPHGFFYVEATWGY